MELFVTRYLSLLTTNTKDKQMKQQLNSYELSRKWFDFCYLNPDKIKPNHTAIYFMAIEHCNRLGWKQKFGFPTTMVMEAIGIKSYNTYIKALNEIVEWGFIEMVEKSMNQYSANIIALSNYNKPLDKALDKAFIKHSTKQSESIDSIDKQVNKETIKQDTTHEFETSEFKKQLSDKFMEYIDRHKLDKQKVIDTSIKAYDYYKDLNWQNSKGKEVKNLYQTIVNNWFKDLSEFRTIKSKAGEPTTW